MNVFPVYLYCGPKLPSADKDERICACAKDFAHRMGLIIPEKLSVNRAGDKPEFREACGIHFSVSHSGSLWAVAIAQIPLGLDIQRHVECNRTGVTKRFFHTNELGHLENNGYADFFDIWTAKESYVKFTGRGIDDNFSAFCVVKNGELTDCLSDVFFYRPNISPGFSACVCCPGRMEVHLVEI